MQNVSPKSPNQRRDRLSSVLSRLFRPAKSSRASQFRHSHPIDHEMSLTSNSGPVLQNICAVVASENTFYCPEKQDDLSLKEWSVSGLDNCSDDQEESRSSNKNEKESSSDIIYTTPAQSNIGDQEHDDGLVYANLAEISLQKKADLIYRQPFPPKPNFNEPPLRVLSSGWREYKTIGGRSFFYNPSTEESQWKPPRNIATLTKSCRTLASRNASISSFNEISTLDPKLNYHARRQSIDEVSSPCSLTGSFADPLNHSIERENLQTKSPFSPYSRDNNLLAESSGYRDKTLDSQEPRRSNQIRKPKVSTNPAIAPIPNVIFEGFLHKSEFLEGSAKIKKWSQIFAVLNSKVLSLYKEQKNSDSKSKHFKAPLEVLDLRGAAVYPVDSDKIKDKRHRSIFSVHLLHNPAMFLFSCTDGIDAFNFWIEAIKSVIRQNPCNSEESRKFSNPEELFGTLAQSTTKSRFGMKGSIRQSVKNKLKASNSRDRLDQNDIPTRESIIDRLLRFLRHRPTLESLYEKGIYKPEPVFGRTLQAVCEHDQANVPKFLTEVIRVIESRGVQTDGIYRVNGNLSLIQKIREHVNHDRYDVLAKEEDIHVLTGTLKLFLRELSEPVIPSHLNKEFMNAMWEKNYPKRLQRFNQLLSSLPGPNKSTLSALVKHLRKVSQFDSENRMNLHSLSIVFGPALFQETKPPKRRGNSSKPDAEGVPNHVVAYNFVAFGQPVSIYFQWFPISSICGLFLFDVTLEA
ncbi:unnamed protein product [Bursaphelenchus xylophilus]|uniref:(pine wood nematode) hypothetical protein n=1 Tax=Bursaphelenchus xylophilus TaxID=6326 RepID=A0A811L2V4_BURXY|nr:unnamed protein product [Bursaphelenchus xylophilus]CAG9108575.1 unnamed protein product [Bursaphelenchus xylophilus]